MRVDKDIKEMRALLIRHNYSPKNLIKLYDFKSTIQNKIS